MISRRSKQIVAAGAVLLASYLVMMLILFPASLGWRLAEHRLETPFALEVGTVTGRVWNGEAHEIRIDGQNIGSIGWRWQPAAMLQGRLGLTLKWTSGPDHLLAELRLGRNSVAARAVRGEVRASQIQAILDLPVLLAGRVHLDVQRIHWHVETNFHAATGVLAWTDAAAGVPQPTPLGQYRGELDSIDGNLAVRIESAPGSPLSAAGSAAWQPPDIYRVDLRLRTGDEGGQALDRVLATMGERHPDGSRRLLIQHP